MGISIFPSTAAEFVSNNFVVDMNDTTNNTADAGGVKQAGPYSMSFSSGDTIFDVYLIDDEGNSVGYSNSTSITASGLFSTVVILGVASDEIITFNYSGSVNNADGEGDEPGAGAYLESITPSDLPSIDDTATVTGGNFGADTEIKFESGATVLDAKNITVNNSTELIVTRPDNLDPDLDPWTLRAITTGVPEPSGTNANILTDVVTAGATPVWVTTSPLAQGVVGAAYTDTLEATDADGPITYAITSGSLPAGLSLNSSTGVISGTTTAGGNVTFTATATDDGGNANSRQFEILVAKATGGTVAVENGLIVHTFTADGTFAPTTSITDADYLIVAGGGQGGHCPFDEPKDSGGGGGAGGLLQGTATLSVQNYSVTVGAGGFTDTVNRQFDLGASGSDSIFGSFGTAIGGGGAASGASQDTGASGGSGGGAGLEGGTGGAGTAGQGFAGGSTNGSDTIPAGGGGASAAGSDGSPSSGGTGAGGAGTTWVDGNTYSEGGFAAGNDNAAFPNQPGSGGQGASAPESYGFAGQDGVVKIAYA